MRVRAAPTLTRASCSMSSRRFVLVPAKPAQPDCKKGELMSFSKKLCGVMGAVGLSLPAAAPALAAPIKAPDAAAMARMVNKGDVTWMLVSAALVQIGRAHV